MYKEALSSRITSSVLIVNGWIAPVFPSRECCTFMRCVACHSLTSRHWVGKRQGHKRLLALMGLEAERDVAAVLLLLSCEKCSVRDGWSFPLIHPSVLLSNDLVTVDLLRSSLLLKQQWWVGLVWSSDWKRIENAFKNQTKNIPSAVLGPFYFIFFFLACHPVVTMILRRLEIILCVTYAMCGSYPPIVCMQ